MSYYETVKRLSEAQVLVHELPYLTSRMIDDSGIVQVTSIHPINSRAWYHPNGLVTLFPIENVGGQGIAKIVGGWPTGIHIRGYRGPLKQYISITGNDGVRRNWLLPPPLLYNANHEVAKLQRLGLTLSPHPDKLYVPISPLPDYELSIDRSLKKAAWAQWDDFFKFIDVMWDLFPGQVDDAESVRLTNRRLTDLDPTDRNTWSDYVHLWKLKRLSEQRRREAIEDLIMTRDMPYAIKRVPEIKVSHNRHWNPDLIRELGKAGRLDDLPELE